MWSGSFGTMQPITPTQSGWLNLLRWVAAFLVCIEHVRVPLLADFSSAGHQPWPVVLFYSLHGYGHSAVVVFFVLSGFLVGGEVVREYRNGVFRWRGYLAKRMARIYPVYLLALGLTWGLDTSGARLFEPLYHGEIVAPMLRTDFAARLTPGIGFGNLLFLQEILVPPFGSNGPLWSLSYEAWYYVLFPLAVFSLFGKGSALQRALSILAVGAIFWFVGNRIAWYFGIWLLGLLPVVFPRLMPKKIWIPALCMLGILATARLKQLPVDGFWVDFSLACAVVLFIGALGRHSIHVPGPKEFHRCLADFSYSLYLVHFPAALFLCAALHGVWGVPLRAMPVIASFGTYAAVIVTVYLFAFAFSRLTEYHTPVFRRWLSKLFDPDTKYGKPTVP